MVSLIPILENWNRTSNAFEVCYEKAIEYRLVLNSRILFNMLEEMTNPCNNHFVLYISVLYLIDMISNFTRFILKVKSKSSRLLIDFEFSFYLEIRKIIYRLFCYES